jgi:hypothetical protein
MYLRCKYHNSVHSSTTKGDHLYREQANIKRKIKGDPSHSKQTRIQVASVRAKSKVALPDATEKKITYSTTQARAGKKSAQWVKKIHAQI